MSGDLGKDRIKTKHQTQNEITYIYIYISYHIMLHYRTIYFVIMLYNMYSIVKYSIV